MSVCLALGVVIPPALAAPKVTEKVEHYLVSATTLRGIKNEMKAKGPNGYWAEARWLVTMSGRCDLQVEITYTLPKHKNPQAMSANVRAMFDKMQANLIAHEKQHGQNGINAAKEAARSGCKNTARIMKKYNKADRDLDRRTRHGRTDGVRLN